jgi:hypothetical protein
MKKLLRTLFLMIVVGIVVAGVASYMSKKRLESKSDDEIREFLARKLDGKVGEEQLATIQDAVIGGIRGKSASPDAAQDDDDADTTEVKVVDEEETEPTEDDTADESSEEVSAE